MNLTDLSYEEEAGLPAPRKQEIKKESKANSRRAELLGRCLIFLNYKQPKIFAIKVSHLSIDDIEYILSASKAWKKNGPALFWKMLRESTPKISIK